MGGGGGAYLLDFTMYYVQFQKSELTKYICAITIILYALIAVIYPPLRYEKFGNDTFPVFSVGV